jgi:hypothetical protein
VPVFIQGLEQISVLNLPVAAGTALWLGVRLDGEHLYTWEEKRRKMSERRRTMNNEHFEQCLCRMLEGGHLNTRRGGGEEHIRPVKTNRDDAMLTLGSQIMLC